MAVGIASLDHEVTALKKADIGKPLPYTTQCLSIGTFRSDPEITKAYPLIRLGKRHAKRCGLRPCRCCAAQQRDEIAPPHVWMAPAWQEIIWRAAQRSLAVMCPACWCSPGGLLARMGSANRVLIIRTGSMSR